MRDLPPCYLSSVTHFTLSLQFQLWIKRELTAGPSYAVVGFAERLVGPSYDSQLESMTYIVRPPISLVGVAFIEDVYAARSEGHHHQYRAEGGGIHGVGDDGGLGYKTYPRLRTLAFHAQGVTGPEQLRELKRTFQARCPKIAARGVLQFKAVDERVAEEWDVN
jgi:hypothetical protein